MTGSEWRTGRRPVHLLDFGYSRLSVRQQRLIAIASCRTISPDVLGASGERWLATADKLAEQPDVRLTAATVRKWWRDFWRGQTVSLAHPNLTAVYFQVGLGEPRTTMVNVGSVKGTTGANYDVVDEAMADVVRDVVGDPFDTEPADHSWFTSTTVALARQMYGSRDFSAMPILADALQDAGCEDDDILSHCRQPGEHVRGCWLVDLLTGRK